MKTVNYKNLTLLNVHPGSGNIGSHNNEIARFERVFDNVRENPVMIELGSFWALWSLIFKNNFRKCRNILVEPIKENLEIGKENFRLNNFDCECYNVGIFFDKITQQTKDNFNEKGISLEDIKSCSFTELYEEFNLDVIDCLHADIQGSEKFLIDDIFYLLENKKILNLILATHSTEIDNYILNKLKPLNGEIFYVKYSLQNGDGEIYFRIDKNEL